MNIKLVKHYGYEQARILRCDELDGPFKFLTFSMPRELVRGLEDELVGLAGLSIRDNKNIYIFDTNEERIAVEFWDGTATFAKWTWHPWNEYPENLIIK